MKKILILSANPRNTNRLRLDEEVREIQHALERAQNREAFELITRGAVRIDDLRRTLLDSKPIIVHFSGHGTESNDLVLENISGEPQTVNPEPLSQLFELCKEQIECVLLNACYSEIQAEAIHRHIDCVIGMVQPIQDSAAINFSKGFYDAIFSGRNYADAFRFGCNNIDLNNIPSSNTPTIKIRHKDSPPPPTVKSGKNVRPDENSQRPEQINQGIIDDTQVGRDVNIETINQNITINNPLSTKTLRLKVFQAPPTPEYYVDRIEVSQNLKQRLLADGDTLVISAIHGLGSVGKSTLAAALAHDPEIQQRFCDGVLWVTLGQEPDVLSLLSGWVQGLGDYNYRATSIASTSTHLSTLLFDKAVLLVVDDAWIDEHNGWEHVQAFKIGGYRCRMLVTSRDASVANFLGASTYSLDVMTGDDRNTSTKVVDEKN